MFLFLNPTFYPCQICVRHFLSFISKDRILGLVQHSTCFYPTPGGLSNVLATRFEGDKNSEWDIRNT